VEIRVIAPRNGVLIALVLALAAAPTRVGNRAVAGSALGSADVAASRVKRPTGPRSVERGSPSEREPLPPPIEAQIATIQRLAATSAGRSHPDPRLFDALQRLEEMLPRSAATRRAQEGARRAYLTAVTPRSLKLARRWPALRASVERVARRDREYVRAVRAVDRRLGFADTPATVSKPATAATPAHSLPFDQMRPGDIMIWDDRSGPPLVRVALSLFAWKCTHSAIYLGETATPGHGVQRWTLEAQSPSLGVVRTVIGRKWTRPGLHVSLGHVRGIAPAQAAQLVRAAVRRYGADGRTPYHTFPPWDKTYTRDGLYCSQLVWSVYRPAGIDLDSNDWRYLSWFTVHNWFNPYAAPTAYFAVFPDEIKRSPQIQWYYDQVNR
jgi:hypothetical protein